MDLLVRIASDLGYKSLVDIRELYLCSLFFAIGVQVLVFITRRNGIRVGSMRIIRWILVGTFALTGIPGILLVGWPFSVGMTLFGCTYLYVLLLGYERAEKREDQVKQ